MRSALRIAGWIVILMTLIAVFILWRGADDYFDSTRSAVWGCVIIAVIGSIISRLLLRFSGPPPSSKWTDGRVGVGTVTKWRKTGLRGGVRTYGISMDVEGEDGTHFTGTLPAAIGRRRLQAIKPGYRIPVMYQAGDPKHLRVPQGQLAASAQLMYDYVQQRDGLVDQETLNADYWGIPAIGEVRNVRQTGRTHRDQMQFELQLMVFPGTAPPFPSTALVFLSPYEQRLMQLAPRIDVKYLPDAPQRVVVKIPANTKNLTR